MHQLTGASPDALFVALLARRPDAPLVTWYDETPGRAARVELSARSLATWAAKTAGLLGDELGLGPGDRVAVSAVPHWLTPGLLAGAWHAGVEVVTTATDPGGTPVAAAFVVRGDPLAADADDVFTLDPTSPLQLGRPDAAAGPPAHARDLPSALRPHADRLGPSRADPAAATLDGRAGASLVADAVAAAQRLGLTPGAGRLLWSGGLGSVAALVDAVLAPWAVGGSLVMVTADAPADPVATDSTAAHPSAERLAAVAASESVSAVH